MPAKPDDLEALQFTPTGGEAIEQQQQQQQQQAQQQATEDKQRQQQEQLLWALKMGTAALVTAALKAARANIGKKVPEIHAHWPDEMLEEPGRAAVPVLERYASSLLAQFERFPELVMLGMACVPLGLGYVNAMSEHRKRAANTVDVQATPKDDGGGDGSKD